MASKIGITKSEVNKIIDYLEEEKENIDGYATKLDTELADIDTAWKGADATKYTNKMRSEYKQQLKDLNESLQSYIDFLSGVYDEYQKLDDKFAAETIEV